MRGAHISLCTGYGGLDMAVEQAFDVRTVAVADVCGDPTDPEKPTHHTPHKGVCVLLDHRFPDAINIGDITEVDWTDWESLGLTHGEAVEVMSGGTPCQDLSHAGARKGMTEGTRSNLWVAMRDGIAVLRPKYVVWENVRGAYSAEADSDLEFCPGCMGDGRPGTVLRALGRVLGDLSDLGYDVQWRGLRAADVGAPHGRFRVFVLATRRDVAADAGGEAVRLGTGLREGQSFGIGWGRPDHDGAPGATPDADDAGRLEHAGAGVVAVRPEHAAAERAGDPVPDAGHGPRLGERARSRPAERGTHAAAHTERVGLQGVGGDAGPGEGRPAETAVGRGSARGGRAVADSDGGARGRGADVEVGGPEGRAAADGDRAGDDAVPDAAGVGRREGGTESAGIVGGPDAPERGGAAAPDTHSDGLASVGGLDTGRRDADGRDRADGSREASEPEARVVDWGDYAPAVERWAAIIGRPAPSPTEPGAKGQPRLNPAFVEWMMGLPEGWVTAVTGLTRNQMLHALGNGVVPQQAYAAIVDMLAFDWPVAA